MSLKNLNPTMDKLLKCFKLDITYARGSGVYLYDLEGNSYLDFIAQYGAVPFGYNPPEIVDAAKECLDNGMPVMIQPSVPIKAVELAEKLIQIAPGRMAQATFCQSGAEAVETAIKLARSTTGRQKILSTKNSFHGKTLGALSATGRKVYQEPFFLPASNFEYVAFNDLDALENILERQRDDIAAFIVEPIQGEGGIIIPSHGYLKGAELLCQKYGVVFIIDEIQTGLGRTGSLFACDKEEVEPDILLLSKALGGGLVPIGVCLSSKEIWNDEFGRLHSSTFANNNFTCSVSIAVLEKLLKNGCEVVNNVTNCGNHLMDGLRRLDGKYPGVIKEIRGIGLMVGLEFNEYTGAESLSIGYLVKQGGFAALVAGYLLHNHGLRVAPFLNNPMTLRLQPSLTITKDEIDIALRALDSLVEILYYNDFSHLYGHLIEKQYCFEIRDCRQLRKEITGSKLDPEEEPKEKFAFLIHYPAEEDVVKNNPSFQGWSNSQLTRFLDWEASMESKPDAVVHLPAIKSRVGKIAEGWLIGVPYSGRHLLDMPRKEAVKVLGEAVDFARDLGAKIVGLGAYTSVVSRGGSDLQGRNVAITSGNSYTIATAFDALIRGADLMAIDRTKAIGSVIGATGAIGRVCAILLSEEVEQLFLVGNPAKEKTSLRRLERLADEIYERAFQSILSRKNNLTPLKGVAKTLNAFINNLNKIKPGVKERISIELEGNGDFSFNSFINENLQGKGRFSVPPIRATININQALVLSDLVISASNSTSELIGPGQLKPGSVVCDVARPADVSKAVLETRKDVLVIEGGLVKYPDPICFGQNMGYDPGTNLACLSETMLMALEGDYRDISIGLKISVEDVYYLKTLAAKHGFELAMPRNENGEITTKTARATKEAAIATNLNLEKA